MRTETLQQILHDAYGLTGSTLSPIERGYTNRSYVVEHGAESYVLRCGWPGKSLEQARREERVLAWLAHNSGPLTVPRVVLTTEGQAHLRVGTRTLHLFSLVPGEVLYHWSDTCSDEHLEAAITSLARLHRILRDLDTGGARSQLAELSQELDAIEGLGTFDSIRATPSITALLEGQLTDFVSRARALCEGARATQAGTSALQWCHGDYQLENLLFENDSLVGLVDFDRLHLRTPEMDLAFALFNLTRDGTWEEGFRWDRARWRRGASIYGDALGDSLVDQEWSGLFCLDQALQHLRAGLDGVWELDRGIGFLSAFTGVLQS